MRSTTRLTLCLLTLSVAAWGARADTQTAPDLGPVTNLPIPRFVSMKAADANARRGPSLSHRVDWVFSRRNMPLEITAEFGHWRRVRDMEGAGGWVHYALLSGVRYVVVTAAPGTATDASGTVIVIADMKARPNETAPLIAYVEEGVVARLGDCVIDWCEITTEGYSGWLPKTRLWGVGADEIRD